MDVIIRARDHSASRSRSPFQLKFARREVPIGPENQEYLRNFQLFPPNFEPVFYVKNPNFLESGEGEEERMERLERSILSHKCENLISQELVIVRNTTHIL